MRLGIVMSSPIHERIQALKDQITDLQAEVVKAQSNVSRAEGQLSQIKAQREGLESKAQEKFGCTVKELKGKMPEWLAEAEELAENIQTEIEAINGGLEEE
jgi:chromosome segregation ATPase